MFAQMKILNDSKASRYRRLISVEWFPVWLICLAVYL